MPFTHKRILAIDPGAKHSGFALIEGRELVRFGVKTFKVRKPVKVLLAQVHQAFAELISDYNPSVVAIEKPFLPQQENLSNLGAVSHEIKKLARGEKLSIVEYSPKRVRQQICDSGKATKRQTARMLCQRYPELTRYLQQKNESQLKYWLHMFDALALAVACLENGKIKT